MKKNSIFLSLILLAISGMVSVHAGPSASGYFTGHFQVAWTGNGYNQMNINILEAKLGGVDLSTGDEIAAFDGATCVGALTYPEATIIASQANGGVPGFTAGHTITIKFWDASNGVEIPVVTITDNSGQPYSPTYEVLSSAFLRLSAKTSLTIQVSGADNKVYDGSTDATISAGNVTKTGLAPGHTVDVTFSGTRFDTKHVGNGKTVTADVSISGTDAAYYTANTMVTTAANITARGITITATAKTKVYGDADQACTATVTSGSVVSGDAASGSLTRESGTGVGTYAITQGTYTYGTNYNETFVGANLTITALPAVVTPASGQSKAVGTTDPAFYYTVSPTLITGNTMTGALSREPGETIGTYAFTLGTLSAGDNYSLSIAATPRFSIIANKAVTITITASQSKSYGAADPVFTYTCSPALDPGDSFTGALSRDPGEAVGSYTYTLGSLSAGASYILTISGSPTFSITPKAVTVSATAGQTKVYGTADPVFSYTSTPALGGSDAFTGALSRAAGSQTGSYAMTLGSLTAGANYTVSFVSAGFSITAKPIAVTAVTSSKTYDGTTASAGIPTISPSLIAGDTPGFIQEYDLKAVGTNKYLYPSGLVSDGNGGQNYTVTFIPVYAGAISKLTIKGSITAQDKPYDGNTTAVILLRTLTGAIPGDNVSYSGGTATFSSPDVGNNKTVTATGLTLAGTDAPNYSVNTTASTTASITWIVTTSTSVSANPPYVQYSDRVILTAIIPNGAPVGTGLPAAKSVTFALGGEVMKDSENHDKIPLVTVGSNLVASLSVLLSETTITGSLAPGARTVTATFNEPDVSFSLSPNPATATMTIVQEDAIARYTGDLLVAAPAGGKASVLLQATIQDISAEDGTDTLAGDIRNATVSFVNQRTNAIIGTVPVILSDPADLKTGTALLEWTGVAQDDYVIGIVVNNYYARNYVADNTIVEVYEDTGDYMTGGGDVIPTLSSGQLVSDAGTRANIGFDLKFNDQGVLSHGHTTILIRQTVERIGRLFELRSTEIAEMAVNVDSPDQMTGGFTGTATLWDITNPLLPVEIAGNLTLNINMIDKGNPGITDGIAIRVWSGAILYYSSHLVADKTASMELTCGDLVINSRFNVDNQLVTGLGEIGVEPGSGAAITAYPNPSPGAVSFKFNAEVSSYTTLDIVSMNGTVVSRVYEGYVDRSGDQTIGYSGRLPQGIYFYRLNTAGRILHGKLVITGTN